MQMGGDAARSPRAIQTAAVVNLSGDMMNALLFHGGMAGMALATTLSCYCELFVLLVHFRSQRAILRPSAGGGLSVKQLMLLSEGIPPMLRDVSAFLSGILINRLAFSLGGENAVAVLAVGSSVWAFLLPAAISVSGACTTLGSVSFGEADSHALQTVFRLGVWYCLLPCTAYALVFIAAAGPLAFFCTGGGVQMLNMALPYLRILAFNRRGTELLKAADPSLPIGTSLAELERSSDCAARIVSLEKRASVLRSLGTSSGSTENEYTRQIRITDF